MEKLKYTIKIIKSDHKIFFELTNKLINKEKWKEIDIDASGFQKNIIIIDLKNIKMESRYQE